MTSKHRKSSSNSVATSRMHRQRTPTHKVVVEEEDYDHDADASNSQYNDESQVEDYEKCEEEEEEDNDVDVGSESMSNAPSNDPSFSHGIEKKSPSVSAFDFPIPSSSYIKIAPLPIFRGSSSESPITHLSRFNKVCRANNASTIDMLKRIFPVTLEDEAALWYDLNIEPYYHSISWEEIKISFLQAYYKFEPIEELRSKLMGIHQGESESVRSYFLRLQWILNEWPEHGLQDNVLKGVFVDGLRTEFHDWVLMQKPNSLNDALKLAFCFEHVRSVRGKKEMIIPTYGLCEGPHEEHGCEVREEMRNLWRQNKKMESDLVRSFSLGESSVQGKVDIEEGEKGGEVVVQSVKKNQCQCTKHKCWKKKLLRNSSLESSNHQY